MFVFSNLATSLDGKIATRGRELFHLGTPADRKQMQVLRKKADVIVMGASTLRTHQAFCPVFGAKKQPVNALISSNLEGISPIWPFFLNPLHRRILFITKPLKPSRRKEFEKTSEVVELRDPARTPGARPIAEQILAALEDRGLNQVLVEGGGGIMWDFVSQNLIHEYHITLTPRVIGGSDSPTLVDGLGFSPEDVLNLKLIRCRRLGDELYLTYRRPQRKRTSRGG